MVVEHLVQSGGQRLVHHGRIVAVHQIRFVTVPGQQVGQLVIADAGQQRRVRDLVAVQVQDRQHGAVAGRVEELVRMPRGGQRPGLRLAVADHTGDHEVRVVQRRAIGMGKGVAELAALVDRAGRLRRHVARDPAREGELPEQALHTQRVPADLRVDLAVRALQPDVGHHARTAMAGAGHEQHVLAALSDDAVEVGVEQVEPWGRPPVPEQSGLHMFGSKWFPQQRVVHQVDLPYRQVVGGPPVSVEPVQLRLVQYGAGHDPHADSPQATL